MPGQPHGSLRYALFWMMLGCLAAAVPARAQETLPRLTSRNLPAGDSGPLRPVGERHFLEVTLSCPEGFLLCFRC